MKNCFVFFLILFGGLAASSGELTAQSVVPASTVTAYVEGQVAGITHSGSLGQVCYLTRYAGSTVQTEGVIQPWFPIVCMGDFTADGVINISDLLILMAGYGCAGSCATDINEDGTTNVSDILLFMAYFGTACP
jgi:hypothetical protein